MYIIAEVGSVHDGSFGNACKLIELAASLGADAVKFQTHISEAETLRSAKSPSYFNSEDRYGYFNRTSFSIDQWEKLKTIADEKKIDFLSSPFSLEAIDLLEKINISKYKIPSGEVTNLPLLEKISTLNKPVLLSSGMSSWSELDVAVELLKPTVPLTVLQCTSEYPCMPEDVGLNVITEMKQRYRLPVGFSDHTLGFSAAIAAVALGATVIEKHLTFSRSMYGSDAQHSMEPDEFQKFVSSLRDTYVSLNSYVNKNLIEKYQDMKLTFQKSIVTSMSLKAGTFISNENICFKKPGTGISAADYRTVLGKKLLRDYEKNELLNMVDLV